MLASCAGYGIGQKDNMAVLSSNMERQHTNAQPGHPLNILKLFLPELAPLEACKMDCNMILDR